jgi:hypothetical protein
MLAGQRQAALPSPWQLDLVQTRWDGRVNAVLKSTMGSHTCISLAWLGDMNPRRPGGRSAAEAAGSCARWWGRRRAVLYGFEVCITPSASSVSDLHEGENYTMIRKGARF